jgi:DNA segregation ATPase FtsK/SpoIIIE-like protein
MASPWFSNPFADDRLTGASAYSPALDVPSFNQAVSDTLLEVIQRASRMRTAEARRKIYILLGGPGYGKTHLMGRIGHNCQDRALFVFVPQIEERGSAVKHIHWHLVESLFRAPTGEAPVLHRLLTRLVHHSFRRYFDFLPHTVKEQHKGLRQRLESDVNVVGEIVAASAEPAPFLRLADSINYRLPTLPLEVLRALVLGWSPWAAEARRWLRGDDLEDEKRAALKLPEEPPTTTRLLQTIAALIHRLGMTVVLCCDQSEALVLRPDAAEELGSSLMGWLDGIPNLVLTLSCLKDQWVKLKGSTTSSFRDRAQELELFDLTGPQALELIRCRLAHWRDRRAQKGPFWPFREADLLAFATRKPRSPRVMLKACAGSMETWIDKQGHLNEDSEAAIDPGTGPRPMEDLFRLEWVKALEEVRKKKLSPDDLQEERLFRSVREALDVFKFAKTPIGGLELLQVQDGALGNARLGLQLKLGVKSSPDAVTIVVALTKVNGGPRLAGFINALKEAVADPVAGAVLVRPGSELTLGSKTAARQIYETLKERGKLRPFALLEHRETFETLECLASMVDKATQHDLQLSQKTISPDECRELVARSQVLAGLDLAESIFCGWPQAEVIRARAGVVQPTAKAELASRAADVHDAAGHAKPAGVVIGGSPSAPQSPEEGSVWAERMLRAVAAKLTEFGQRVEPLGSEVGPTFVRLKLRPLGKTSVGKVCNHANDLRTHIPGISRVPLIADQPGFISVDVERPNRQPVPLAPCLRQPARELDGQPAFPVGVDVSGKVHWLNLADPSTCHLLVAGTTGSGKSEFLKSLVTGLATRLSQLDLRFVFIDPKRVTFNFPAGTPYLLHPVAHTVEEAMPLIQECFEETERRYAVLEEKGLEHVGQLTGKHALPRIVVLFDEFADLMADRETRRDLETTLKRIGALARAAGIHLVLATQRPDKDVVTPLLRANLPTRVCLRVDSERNSNIILDEEGGERLLGRGDLFWKFGGGMIRLQGAFVTKDELEKALRVG